MIDSKYLYLYLGEEPLWNGGKNVNTKLPPHPLLPSTSSESICIYFKSQMALIKKCSTLLEWTCWVRGPKIFKMVTYSSFIEPLSD